MLCPHLSPRSDKAYYEFLNWRTRLAMSTLWKNTLRNIRELPKRRIETPGKLRKTNKQRTLYIWIIRHAVASDVPQKRTASYLSPHWNYIANNFSMRNCAADIALQLLIKSLVTGVFTFDEKIQFDQTSSTNLFFLRSTMVIGKVPVLFFSVFGAELDGSLFFSGLSAVSAVLGCWRFSKQRLRKNSSMMACYGQPGIGEWKKKQRTRSASDIEQQFIETGCATPELILPFSTAHV